MLVEPIKCVVIGDDSVGKTSLLITYNTNKFPDFVPTVYDNNDNYTRIFDFYDTTNEHPQLIQFIYEEADVFIICFSLVCPKSIENVVSLFWPNIKKFRPETPYILVGTKSDLRDEVEHNKEEYESKEVISKEKGEEIRKKIGAKYYVECSSKKQINIKEVFECAIKSQNNNDDENTCCFLF